MASKKDKIKALRMAKSLIKDDSFYHICHALRRVGWGNPHLEPSTNYLRDYISKQLGGNFMCLEGWHEKKRIAINMNPKTARIMWINWMIACLEGKEYNGSAN